MLCGRVQGTVRCWWKQWQSALLTRRVSSSRGLSQVKCWGLASGDCFRRATFSRISLRAWGGNKWMWEAEQVKNAVPLQNVSGLRTKPEKQMSPEKQMLAEKQPAQGTVLDVACCLTATVSLSAISLAAAVLREVLY